MRRCLAAVAACLVGMTPLSVCAADIYVSPTGDDLWAGTRERPLRTLEAARAATRALKQQGQVTVWLRGGVHRRAETFLLGADDSGTMRAPIVYRACPDETPILQGSRTIAAEDFRKVANAAILARLPEVARGQVYVLDGHALGLRHLGPWPDLVRENGTLLELFCNGKRMPLARWPNNGPTTMKRVLHAGDSANKWHRPGAFEYRDDRHARWPVEEGVWLRGYWSVPWQLDTVRIGKIDPAKKTITLSQPIAGGIGSKFMRPLGSGKEPYWVVNLLEELDQPGEWCIDFHSRKLYFWPPTDLKSANVVLADLDAPVIACRNAAWITFRGLTLEGGLGNAVEITGGRDVLVAGCDIRGFGRSGVKMREGEHHGVQSCDLHHLGDSGILMEGGSRTKLTPTRHFAHNNHIHHVGEVKRSFSAGINVGFYPVAAVGMHLANNLIHDTPHAGILYGGNDNVIEFNDVHHVCLKATDTGALYTYHDWTSRGNIIRNNYVHHSPTAHGVYCDDGDSGDVVTGNVMYKIETGIVIGGGHDNTVTGNLVIDSKAGAVIDARGVKRGFNTQNATMVSRVKSANPENAPWSERFPNMGKMLNNHPELPTGNVIDDNVFVMCRRGLDKKATPEELRYSRIGKNLDLSSAPELRVDSKLEPRLHSIGKMLSDIAMIRPLPMQNVGIYRDEYRKVLPK